jgi:hypothetical protein
LVTKFLSGDAAAVLDSFGVSFCASGLFGAPGGGACPYAAALSASAITTMIAFFIS